MASIINPFNPNTSAAGQTPEEQQTNILTPQNIKTPQEMMNYMLSDMRQLVYGFEQTRSNQILMVAQINKLGSMVVKLTEENSRLRKAFAQQGIVIEEVEAPELPAQAREVLEAYEEQKHKDESQAFEPHPNHVSEQTL